MIVPVVCCSAPEVATINGLSISTVRKRTRSGEIPHIIIGRRILYPITSVQEWMFANTIGLTDPKQKGEINGKNANGEGTKYRLKNKKWAAAIYAPLSADSKYRTYHRFRTRRNAEDQLAIRNRKGGMRRGTKKVMP